MNGVNIEFNCDNPFLLPSGSANKAVENAPFIDDFHIKTSILIGKSMEIPLPLIPLIARG